VSLDLDNLRNAVASLDRSLRVAETMPDMPLELRETVRAGVIQNFEVAYESSWKFIQRWLRENTTPTDADSPNAQGPVPACGAHGASCRPDPMVRFWRGAEHDFAHLRRGPRGKLLEHRPRLLAVRPGFVATTGRAQ